MEQQNLVAQVNPHIRPTQKETVEHFRQMLASRPAWALRGLVRIYERQTDIEKASQLTCVNNKVGFTGFDAEILSSIAEQYKSRGTVSPGQMVVLHKRMPKYAGQLLKITKAMA